MSPPPRRPPRRPPNPGFKEPRVYLRAGFFAADGAPRPELATDLAAAMGRELVLTGVPLTSVAQVLQEVELITRLSQDWAGSRRRLAEIATRETTGRYPMLSQLLTAGLDACRKPADLTAFARHVRRVYTLAAFTRTLGEANARERARTQRQAQVVKHRRRDR